MSAPKTDARPYGIHWFRRDLRVAGNPALQANWARHRGRVLGLFTFDRAFLSRPDFSNTRFAFFVETLAVLRDELRSQGGDLLVLDVGPEAGFQELMAALERVGAPRPSTVSLNRDYEPFARARDAALPKRIPELSGADVLWERDHLLIEPHELTKPDDGGWYQTYSPFGRRWFSLLSSEMVQERLAAQRSGLAYLRDRERGKQSAPIFSLTWPQLFGATDPPNDHLESFRANCLAKNTVALPPTGSLAAYRQLRRFLDDAVAQYAERRDFPHIDGTSQLSIYLKNGSIVSSQIAAELSLRSPDFKLKDGPTVFLKEVAWREFFYHILHHRPEVEQTAFHPKYADLAWENNEEWFSAWTRGETGFPIVDAGMRQLNETGWMHNRVRMIVASFLTKDLLVDWRWGERYFMQQLLDGDLAPNNGGWQWSASTGCDPQPYFRIFNPELQSRKFDADAAYIKKYVPELRGQSPDAIHALHTSGHVAGYARRLVEHAVQKPKALQLFQRESDPR